MAIPASTPLNMFISHSSKDDDFGQRLAEDLRKILGEETSIWYDTRGGLKPGDSWTQAIEDALIACDVFMIIISPDAMESAWVRREFDIALSERKQILPVYYKACTIWPFLRTKQYVSFLSPRTYKAAFQELLLSDCLKKSSSSAPSLSSIVPSSSRMPKNMPPFLSEPQIFLAHSHIDIDFGIRLTQDLRAYNDDEIAIWSAVRGELHGGDTWWSKIVDEIKARDVFIVVLSPDAMNSWWVLQEIDMALNLNKTVIPLLYRTCSIRADLKILQIITFLAPKTYETAFEELVAALGLGSTP